MLRDYQQAVADQITEAWRTVPNVLAVMPTGGGKTVLFCYKLRKHAGPSVAIAHRQELVGQISETLAREGIEHRIIAPASVVKRIVTLRHVRKFKRSYVRQNSTTAVAGVDTLVRRERELSAWLPTVTLWVQDEAHHVLADNKWGKAAAMFPNARGLGVTATPERADGKGLGRHADGLFDTMVQGPSLRDMIDLGWLCDYKIYSPPSDFVVSDDMIGSTGDYSHKKLSAAAKKSHIVGDVVEHYRKLGNGGRGVTFYPDVETATAGAAAYVAAGIPALAVSAKTDDIVRAQAVDRLGSGDYKNLTNCDIFGEGFDLPAIEVVSMARPTASFSLFCQQVGRALRPMYAAGMPLDTPEQRRAAIAAGPKPRAIIIDHVQNVRRHAVARHCPIRDEMIIDVCFREWTLDRREKRARKIDPDVIPLTMCLNPECFQYYESTKPACPHCSTKPEPSERSTPEQVAGDLHELDPSTMDTIIRQVAKVDGPVHVPQGIGRAAELAIHKRHGERKQAQELLRTTISWWAAWERQEGRCNSEMYRRFYHFFGVDVMTAQTLGAREASDLNERVAQKITEKITTC